MNAFRKHSTLTSSSSGTKVGRFPLHCISLAPCDSDRAWGKTSRRVPLVLSRAEGSITPRFVLDFNCFQGVGNLAHALKIVTFG